MREHTRSTEADFLRLFSLVWQPLSGLQRAVSVTVDGWHAAQRLDKLLRIAERADDVVTDPSAKLAVNISQAHLRWTPSDATALDEKPFELELDLQIPRGELVAIVGAISTGKTALCRTLAGHLQLQSGSVTVGALAMRGRG